MILNSRDTTVAYRCPACGKHILGMVGIFTLSGDLIKLKCDCGGSEMIIAKTADQKIRLSVPCVICPDPHLFTVSGTAFFDRDLISLSCPYSDLAICWIGTKKNVGKALEASDREFLELLKESGIEDFDAFTAGRNTVQPRRGSEETEDDEEEPQFDDITLEDTVNLVLAELEADGELRCACDGCGEYTYSLERGKLTVRCDVCGAEATVSLRTRAEVESFIRLDRLTLTDPDGDAVYIDEDLLPTLEEHVELNDPDD